MKVLNFNSTRLRNAEYISLCNDVLKQVKTYDWETANVLNLLTWVKDSTSELKNRVNKMGTVNETLEVKQADDRFNDAWRAIKAVTKAHRLSPLEAERDSAAVMSELINSYGDNLHIESYEVQNATAKLFLKACNKPEIKAAVENLKIQSFVGNIEAALNQLVAAIDRRKAKSVGELKENETREIRNRLHANLNKMFRYMEVMSDVAPGGPLDNMINEINLSIQKIETAIKKRRHTSQELEETEMT